MKKIMVFLLSKMNERRLQKKELREKENQLKKDLKNIQKQRRSVFKKFFRRVSLVSILLLTIIGGKNVYNLKTFLDKDTYVSPYDTLVSDANGKGNTLINSLVSETYGTTKEQKMVIMINDVEYPVTRETLVRDNGSNFINVALLNAKVVAKGDRFLTKIGNEEISFPEHCLIKQEGRTYLDVSQIPFFRNLEEDGVYILEIIY